MQINQLTGLKQRMRERRSRNLARGLTGGGGKKGRKLEAGFITNDMKTSTVQ